MVIKALIVWFGLVVLAVVNGIIRNSLFTSRLGELPAHVVSTLILCAVIAFIAWLSIPWRRPATWTAALGVGALWLSLTIAFEFVAGHYFFGHSWQKLFADYNVARGRVWILVLATTILAPFWAHRVRAQK